MRSLFAFLATLLLAVGAFTACQKADATKTTDNKSVTAQAPAPAPGDSVTRISIDDARAAVEKGAAIIVDARDAKSYKDSHIKGSINIYAPEVVSRIKELPKDKTIIFYCS